MGGRSPGSTNALYQVGRAGTSGNCVLEGRLRMFSGRVIS